MKAVVFYEYGGPEVLRVEDVPVPEIGPDDVLIRMRAVTVNRTLDIDVRTWGATWPIPFPHIVGADPAGDVVQVGAAVSGFEAGDRVVTNFILGCGTCELCIRDLENACPRRLLFGVRRHGGYAEYASVPSRNLVRIPPSLSYQQSVGHDGDLPGRLAPAHRPRRAQGW